MSPSQPNIGVVALDRWRGGVIYTHNLVRALSRLPASERPRITLFCRSSAILFEEIRPSADKVVVFESLLDKVFGNTRLDVPSQRTNAAVSAALLGEAAPELALPARREKVDVIFPVMVPYTRLQPTTIAWIPDLQHCVLPEFFSRLARAARDKSFSALLHDPNRHVIFSSQCALDDATRAYGKPLARTHILHFATVPMPEWFRDPAPVVANYRVPASFFILCNQFWIHKDHLTAFRAVAKLKGQGLKVHLVCTGPTQDNRNPEFFPHLKSQIKELGIQEQVQILGLIPRIDQVSLIRASKAVVQPSRFEGWSTVIEDARALDKPVIASDFPVHLEQNAPGSSFFRMGDVDDCAQALARAWREDNASSLTPACQHDDRIVEFARGFMRIVNQVLSRSPVAVSEVAAVSS